MSVSKHLNHVWIVALMAFLGAGEGLTHADTPVGSAFTYQGRIKQAGVLITGRADFRFRLWNEETAGMQIGATQIVLADQVVLAANNVDKGLFTAAVDFGPDVFDGNAHWMEVAVRSPSNPGAGGGGFVVVSPRQLLNASPYAVSGGGWSVNDVGQSVLIGSTAGIGTANPGTALEIWGQPTGCPLNAFIGTLKLVSGSSVYMIADSDQIEVVGSDLLLNHCTQNNVQIAKGGGVVSIGTGHPGVPLLTVGDGTGGTTVNLRGSTRANIHLVDGSGASNWVVGRHDDLGGEAGSFHIHRYAIGDGGGTSALFIRRSDGWISVGGPVIPQEHFHCAGNIKANGYICAEGGVNCPSDERLKTNVSSIENALVKIANLRGVEFDWREDLPAAGKSTARQIGFIAQEMQQVLPQVVVQTSDGFLALDYARITPVLVEAVKELESQVQAKDARIEQLEQQMQAMNSRFEAIEARLEQHDIVNKANADRR